MDEDNENTCLIANDNSKTTNGSQCSKWTPIEIFLALCLISSNFNNIILRYFTITAVAERYNQTDFIYSGSSHCNNSTTSTTNNDDIQKESSETLMGLRFCSMFLSVFTLTLLGGISDKFGRKSVLISCLIVLLMKEIIYIIAIYLKLSMFTWYFAQIIDGLVGGSGGVMMMAFEITADVTKPGEKRAFRLIVVEGVGSTVSALSSIGVGYWIQFTGFIYPMIFSIAVTSTNILFCAFFIKETLTIKTDVRRSSLTNVFKHFGLYFRKSPDGRRLTLSLALLLLGVSSLGMFGKTSVQVLFLLNDPLCWNEVHIQVYKSVTSVVHWILFIGVVRTLQKYIHDYGLVSLGTLSAALSLLCFASASKDWLVYIYTVFGIFSSFLLPVLRAMMSRQCTPDEQGSLFSGAATVELIFTAISSIICGELYKLSVSFFPGLVFIVMGCIMVLAFIISIILYRLMAKKCPDTLHIQYNADTMDYKACQNIK